MLLALGITVALPQGASAVVVGWKVNWCAPTACVPGATYYDGISNAQFKGNGGRTCANLGAMDPPSLADTKGGYLNPPEGLYSDPRFINPLRWTFGEPIWCTDYATFIIPFRYYMYDPTAPWNVTGQTLQLGAAAYSGRPSMAPYNVRLQCMSTTNVIADFNSAAAQSAWGSASGGYSGPNARPKTSDGKLSYQALQFSWNGAVQTSAIASATTCAKILSITITVPTDTIGGFKDVQWSGARAINGVENTWGGYETLNCNIQNPPQECIGKGTTPYLIACGTVTIDPGTWGNLGPCIVGTPADYLRGVTALTTTLSMPLPGTGSCSAWTVGTFMGTPFVIDMCGWYPAARPIFDVLMTAGLWIAVVGSVFRTRAGENG